MFTTLIEPADLAGHLDDPHYLVLDCRYDLADTASGEASWTEGHIPGALYAHLDRDLAGPVTPVTGRHPLPDPGAFAATLSRWGVGETTQLVAYDAAGGAFAARLWWLARWAGHDAVAVLDGGLGAWRAAGGRLDRSVAQRTPTRFRFRGRHELAVDATGVAAALDAGTVPVVDARAPERFAGRVEPIDPVAGHVPGALNHPYTLNLGPDGRFLAPAELLRRWRESLGGTLADGAICMCGSGVTACHNILALERAGLAGAKLYAGSWSEWIRSPERPVARGPD